MESKVIYEIGTADIFKVAEQAFQRTPTKDEIQFIENKIGDRISWFDIIEDLMKEYEGEKSQGKKR